MLLVTFCIFLLLFFLIGEKPKTIIFILLSLFPPVLFLLLWLSEYSTGNIDFFTSDEMHYYMVGSSGLPVLSDRFIYYLINYWIINHDIYLHGFSLKIINIVFYLGLIIVVYKIFDKNKYVFLLPFLLPYFAYLAIFNIRDTMILFFTALTIYFYFDKKYVLLSIISIIILYLLRPFAAMLLLAIIILLYVFRSIGSVIKGKINIKAIVVLVSMIVLLLIVSNTLISKISTYQNWLEYTTGEGEQQHIESVSGGSTFGNRGLDFIVSAVRYVTTPQPISLLKRLFQGGSNTWGITDDFVRLLNQISYFILLFFIIVNFKHIPIVFKVLKKSQAILIITLLSYWPIYSFHLYGITHQRLKIPFQIVVFLIFLIIINLKNRKSRG